MTAKYAGAGFAARFGPWAVIAGGSDGIGAAYARELARRGVNVALVARRQETLAKTADALRDLGVEARTISADLTAPDVVDTIRATTDALDVGFFIYNAGSNRAPGKFLDQTPEDALYLVNLSCRAPALLAHHFGNRLRERGRGGLLLMSSMASLAGSAYQAVYAATKAFDAILAEGLWHELAPAGVDVLGVLAGATRTETVLHANEKFADAMDPAEVAVGALDHLGKGPSWVPGAANQAAARGISPTPRVAIINGMSQAGAALFDLEHTPVEGIEYHEA
jgi:short-subunit dehydrogenase